MAGAMAVPGRSEFSRIENARVIVGEMPLLRFCSITKRFPGVAALRGVSFDVRQGACHAWIGENGAGKSTLGKILAGVLHPDEGHFELDGRPQRLQSPLDARRAGIAIVHQELSFCPNLSVAENLCLASLPLRRAILDRAAMYARAARFLAEVGAECDAREEMGRLTAGQTQLVQIATAMASGARVLVLDEPTSSLSAADSQRLEELIAQMRRRGITIVYVSHRMEEIFRICDTVTVLRDGQHVATLPTVQIDEEGLVRLMIGRPLAKYFPSHVDRQPGPERLRVESLCSPRKFENVSFSLRAGEVLGVAGLVGSGRSEVAMAIFGLDAGATGRVFVDGRRVRIRCPQEAIACGIGFVGEDRKRQGIVPEMGCGENLTLAMLDCPGRRGFFGRLVPVARHAPGGPSAFVAGISSGWVTRGTSYRGTSAACGSKQASRGSAHGHVVRRQSAETDSRPMVGPEVAGLDAGRADPRGGCCRQGRDPPLN